MGSAFIVVSDGKTGFFTGLSLILATGAQNALGLRQGLRREYVFWLCIFCSISDAVLGYALTRDLNPVAPGPVIDASRST